MRALDSRVLHKTGRHPGLAHRFINFMLDGRNSTQLTNPIGSGNPNRDATRYIHAEIANNRAVFPVPGHATAGDAAGPGPAQPAGAEQDPDRDQAALILFEAPPMLVWFVVIYLLLSILIGVYAATRVKNSRDYVVAGRSLPIYIVTATVFATWFGSETVLGISSTFLQDGLKGIVADPFGSSLCLILVGLLFAKPLYRMKLLTIGDYYKRRYDHVVEVATSICIILSYLGWVSAQMTALGLVFNILSGGQIDNHTGIVIGAAIVLLYTLFGGMWSVALTDFFQMSIIMVGLGYIAWLVSGMVGGMGVVVAHAAEHGKFEFWPQANARDIVAFIAAWVTMMFGSIPQQDVFQRVMSAKDEKTAMRGSILGGSIYFLFAFVPIFIAYSAFLLMPDMVNKLLDEDAQRILPTLILEHTPLFAQVMFFGALLSAIMSTASGTILAPSATFTENILKVFIRFRSDRHQLWTMRGVVVVFTDRHRPICAE